MKSNIDARAAQARSGKWHLVGGEGCLNASQATFTRRASAVAEDKRNREWCSYCRERLRQLELQAEVERLESELRTQRAVDDLPEHLSLPEFVDCVAEAETLVDLAAEARMPRKQAKSVAGQLHLRQFVDDREHRKYRPSQTGTADGANHGVSSEMPAQPNTGWGQLAGGDGDAE